MSSSLYLRPEPGSFAAYFARYTDLVPDGDILRLLRLSAFDAIVWLEGIPADRWDYRYAEGKWSVKEVILHIIDTERIMACRALRIGRGDKTPLPGFEQDDYVPFSGAGDRTPESLILEFKAVREANAQLFEHLPAEAWDFSGTASNNPITVRALAYIIVGHELYHRAILRERYLV